MAAGIDIARIDEDPGLCRLVEEQLHGQPVAEGEPNIEAALRYLPIRKARKVFVQNLAGRLAASLQFASQPSKILCITATGQEAGQDLLRQGAGAIVNLHLDVTQALYDWFWRNHPADAQPWRQGFGNTAQIKDLTSCIQAFQGWRRRSVKGQFLISSVFDDGQAIAAAQRQELGTALTAHIPARRVVVRRDGIEDAIAYI